MKKIVLIAAAAVIFAAQSASAITVTIGAGYEDIEKAIEDALIDDFGSASDFATATANASAYTYNTGTFVGHQNYNRFSVSMGSMLTVAGATGDIENEGFGVGAAAAFNAGMKANWLLNIFGIRDANDFYLSAKFGGIPEQDFDYDDINVKAKSMIFGIGANYSLIESKLIFRGVSLGTGLYYTSQDVTFTTSMNVSDGTYTFDGDIPVDVEASSFTIPFEAVTGVNLLIFNLSAGAGVDMNFGGTDISSEPTEQVNGNDVIVKIDGGDTSLLKFKLVGALGFSLGPVKIEMPAYYYPAHDYGVGLTAGVVF